MAIQISGTTVIDNSRNLSNIANASTSATANTYVIRNASGDICATNLSRTITSTTPLGSFIQGGYLIYKSSSVAWIVAPSNLECRTSWYQRNSALSILATKTGCSGWFIPTCAQLTTGLNCRTYWDVYVTGCLYWSDTESTTSNAHASQVTPFSSVNPVPASKICLYNVRSFRCVTY